MYAVIGTQKSLNTGLGISAAILIGTLSAIGGGLIRDVLTREEASLLKPGQWYAGTAFGGSVLFCLLSRVFHVPPAVAESSSFSLPSPREFSRTATIFRPGR